MPQNRWISSSTPFQFWYWSRANFLKCPTFLCLKFLKCIIFLFSESDRKNRTFQNETRSILKLKRNRKKSILRHFKKIMQMLSHDKIIFHMLSWAFHDTVRIGMIRKKSGFPYWSFLWFSLKNDRFRFEINFEISLYNAQLHHIDLIDKNGTKTSDFLYFRHVDLLEFDGWS